MRYEDLRKNISTPVFFDYQVQRIFPSESASNINVQLSRMASKGKITRIKRGMYVFEITHIDSFYVSNLLYSPSYISLESALNAYGIVPDIPMAVTAISPVSTKSFNTANNTYFYSKIKKNLFFGYNKVPLPQSSNFYYQMALPEKALLDFLYIRKIKNISDARFNLDNIDWEILKSFAQEFPPNIINLVEDIK